MANENKNINELVAGDDDPTAELEVIELAIDGTDLSELDAKTYDVKRDTGDDTTEVTISDLEPDLRARKRTISRLEYDLEQLHSKWLGLKTEIAAREEQTTDLNAKLAAALENLSRNENLAGALKRQVDALTLELEQRNEEHRALRSQFNELQVALEKSAGTGEAVALDAQPARASRGDENLPLRLQQLEQYADSLRRQLHDTIEAVDIAEREVGRLTTSLDNSSRRNAQLSDTTAQQAVKIDELQTMLENIQSQHEAEIRTLRFELGEAQETVAETENLNSQLASELFDARSFKEELERMLGETEEQYKGRIEELQKEVAKKSRTLISYEQKLTTKSEAISVLLSELAKKSEQTGSASEIEHAIQEIDERISERDRQDEGEISALAAERMTRVLIGTLDDRIIRFPLFKDRLTIGRTSDNDIQLKASYISRRHAVIETTGDCTRIIDTGSKNGIRVNSAPVTQKVLCHGDSIIIGNARFRYEERKMRES